VTAVLLNGVSQMITGNDFAIELDFSIPTGSNFIAGVNTLQFVMFNRAGGGVAGTPSPHGLRVEFTSATATAIPEPSSLLLTALGLLGMAGFRQRRLSK